MGSSSPEDRGKVLLQSLTGICTSSVLFTLGSFVLPVRSYILESPMERVIFALRWQCVSLLPIIIGIQVIALTRFMTNAIDPVGGKCEHLVEVDKRCLQNTIEQFLLNFLLQLGLASYLESTCVRVIPTLTVMFVFSRAVFWIGYRSHPVNRAMGFAMTVFMNYSMLVYLLYCVLLRGPLLFLTPTDRP
ncbi:hypothetical protein CHS0354_012052 [Potamilus streckersoni]|uniref:MAPEG family protein n=1 Tax=Potamilus streckersoni TaxID=2493646 RepID=A0AAE0VY07_9BIVA|nr:hypothetical protein CHS0354_012052 [Potamilus streckersoni]